MGNSKSKACIPRIEMGSKTGVINIANIGLTEKSSIWACEELTKAKNKIKVFDISNNDIRVLPHIISTFSIMKSLNMNQSNISNAFDISNLRCLVSLEMCGNNISNLSGYLFPTSLKKLKLTNNLLTELNNNFQNLTNLTDLNLSSNKLMSLVGIGCLVSLVELQLDDNKISVIPPEIGQLKKLKTISIERNVLLEFKKNIEDSVLEYQSLPSELFVDTSLVSISLVGNSNLSKKGVMRLEGISVFLDRRKQSKDRNLNGGALDDFTLFGLE